VKHGWEAMRAGCQCGVCDQYRVEAAERTRKWYQNGGHEKTKKYLKNLAEALPATRSRLRWTPEEDEMVLRDDLSTLECAVRLDRSFQSVNGRRVVLRNPDRRDPRPGRSGERRQYWTPEEDALVLLNDLTVAELASMLPRSPTAIQSRRSRLRLGEDHLPHRRSDYWTPEDDEVLMRDDLSLSEIADLLERTLDAVQYRRYALGLSRHDYWTTTEDDVVLRDDLTITEMADMLSRTPRAVVSRRSKLRPGPPRPCLRWTPEEDAIVLRDDLSIAEIASALSRGYQAVASRRYHLRSEYVRGPRSRGWTSEEDTTILRDDLSITEMASMLSRSYDAVTRRRVRLRRQTSV
jgi:hypothetical protein